MLASVLIFKDFCEYRNPGRSGDKAWSRRQRPRLAPCGPARGTGERKPAFMIKPQEDASDAFVHPTADVEQGAKVGKYTKVWHFSHVAPGAVIGENCSLGQNTYVERNAIVGNACRLGNSVSIFPMWNWKILFSARRIWSSLIFLFPERPSIGT